jgi:acyl-CoA thioester hydrolase
MSDAPLPRRAEFTNLRPIATRWMDNDHYGHVNNVAYYSFFDTAVNGFLIEATGLDVASCRRSASSPNPAAGSSAR